MACDALSASSPVDIILSHESSSHLSKAPSLQSLCSIIVRLGVSKSTSTIAFLGNHGASAFSRVESAAFRRTISIRGTRTGNELSPSSIASASSSGRGCRSSLSGCRSGSIRVRSAARQRLSGNVVWLSISKSTAAIPFLRNDRTSALPRVETAAFRSAIGIRGAGTGNELRALAVSGTGRSGGSRRRGLDSGCRSGIRISSAAGQCLRGDVVWLRVAESAAAVTLLGDDGPGTFARVEAAAFGSAVGIGCARSRDKLGALGGDIERDYGGISTCWFEKWDC